MNSAVKKRKRGGQPKLASERKRNNLTIRVLDELRERLETAAEKSQRSVSEEAAYRMMLSFNLEGELKDYGEIRKSNDDTIRTIMTRRGWGKVVDPRYGGAVFIPPGQHALQPSGFIDPAKAEAPRVAPAIDTALQHAVEKAMAAALPSALEAAIQHAVEKAVAAALSRATLRIGGDK